ncbi:MAG TPA: hypothetical protein VMX17_16730 [Candidatus Glassbacteria bacterium]|nr:hypothetical protein [Candidatus Glassbacteria bacterium]
MPCYQISIVSVELKMRNKELLLQTLADLRISYRDLGDVVRTSSYLNITFYLDEGMVELPETSQSTYNRIKQRYSQKAIEIVAKKRRWILKQNGNKLTATKY